MAKDPKDPKDPKETIERLAEELGIRIPEDEHRRRVLLVDDNAMILKVVAKQLSVFGYEVDTAENGTTALARARASRPDLILLDIMMPDTSGYEVLQRLKADAVVQEVPVIMVSAKKQKDDIVRSFQLGAADYVLKPFKMERLLEKMAKAMGRPQAAAQPRRIQLPAGPAVEVIPQGSATIVKLREIPSRTDLEAAMRALAESLRPLAGAAAGSLILDVATFEGRQPAALDLLRQLAHYLERLGTLEAVVVRQPAVGEGLRQRGLTTPQFAYLADALDHVFHGPGT
ncbi:MAG: response regulator [Planctomycetes bacterium]|nr:response regulator [Planctomycetota bacterium]